MINIGAEGQLIVGALLTTFVGLQLGESFPGWLGIIILLIAGSLMGAIWGAIPGLLKARLQVNEILSTIMMNAIAIQVAYFLLRGPMIDPAELEAGTNIPHSARLPKNLDMPRFTDIAQALGFTERAKDMGLQGYISEIYGVLAEPTRLHSWLSLCCFDGHSRLYFPLAHHHRLPHPIRRPEPPRFSLCRNERQGHDGVVHDIEWYVCRSGGGSRDSGTASPHV